MEDYDKVGPLLDIGCLEPSGNGRKKERRSFYDMPRTLSEEDDTFGILSNNITSDSERIQSLIMSNSENSVSTGLLVEIESSQSSNDSCEPLTKSTLQSSKLLSAPRSVNISKSRGTSVSSITNSRCFGDISHISQPGDQTTGKSLLSNDSVFDSQLTAEKDQPNWEMIMNDAKILASTINKKDPTTSRLKGSLSNGFFGNLSPAGLDSPLLDLEKEFGKPDEFLVPLTPDRSPVKDLTKQIAIFDIEHNIVSGNDIDINKESADSQENVDVIHSPPLRPLPDHEIDGIRPLVHDETPKKSEIFSSRGSLHKENVKPRQILNKDTTTPILPKKLVNTSDGQNSVEKQIKSKVQNSNVRRTSMTMAQQKNLNKHAAEKKSTSTSSPGPCNKPIIKQDKKTGTRATASKKPGTPLVATPQIRNPSYKNIQSKINSGRMPSVKTAMPTKSISLNAKTFSAKKPICQPISNNPGIASGKKVGTTPCPPSSSNNRRSSAMPMTAPRNVLQRQGSNVIALPPRPSSTTPLKSRQSLSFATPAAIKPAASFSSLKGQTSAQTLKVSSVKTKPPTPSRLKPPTPSRLPSTNNFRTPRLSTVGANNKADQASVVNTRAGQPKSRNSLRFSTLPSPSLTNKENDSALVCSTPALGSTVANNSRNSTLPSPIQVTRRPV